jgi:integrase
MQSPTRADLETAARAFFEQLVADVDQPRSFHLDHSDEEVAWNIEESRARIRALDDQMRANVFDGTVRHKAGELASRCGADIEQLEDRERLFAEQLAARAEREQMEFLVHALIKPASGYLPRDTLFLPTSCPDWPATIFDAPTPLIAATQTTKRYPTLAMVIDDYTSRMRARGLGLSQIDEVSRVLRWLCEEIDPTTGMELITTDQMREFRNNIQRMDRTRQGRASQFRLRLTDILERQIASATAQKYWSSVQAVFAWGHGEGMAPHDPSALFKIDRKKGEVRRSPEPFSTLELDRLYRTPLFAGHQSRSRLANPGECHERGQHWWSGVLPLFTGLRAGEFSQLLPSDFIFDDAVPHLLVQEVNGDGLRTKTTKNASSIRAVPLAPILVELGLRQFVERRARTGTKERVFEKLRLGTGGKISEGMGRFWGDYLRKFGLHKPGRATHVMRHTIIEALRRADVTDEDIAAVVGHSRRTQTSRYGNKDFPLDRKLRIVGQLDFGFDVLGALGGPFDPKLHG